jgi:hypothetical protein
MEIKVRQVRPAFFCKKKKQKKLLLIWAGEALRARVAGPAVRAGGEVAEDASLFPPTRHGFHVESWKPLETALWVVATFWAKASRLAALLPSSCWTVAVEAGGVAVAVLLVAGAADGVEEGGT